jgi:hypothetical protein
MLNDEHIGMKNDESKRKSFKETKLLLRVYVPEEVYKAIRDLAWEKYGRFRGALSYEVEQALRVWLAHHAGERAQKAHILETANPRPKVAKVFSEVKQYLEKEFGYAAILPGQQIPRKHIILAISNVRGPDPRTVRKWFDAFVANKLLRMISPEVYEVI